MGRGPEARALSCPLCGSKFFPASLKFHLKACARKPPTDPLVECEGCRELIVASDALVHSAVCPARPPKAPSSVSKKALREKKKEAVDEPMAVGAVGGTAALISALPLPKPSRTGFVTARLSVVHHNKKREGKGERAVRRVEGTGKEGKGKGGAATIRVPGSRPFRREELEATPPRREGGSEDEEREEREKREAVEQKKKKKGDERKASLMSLSRNADREGEAKDGEENGKKKWDVQPLAAVYSQTEERAMASPRQVLIGNECFGSGNGGGEGKERGRKGRHGSSLSSRIAKGAYYEATALDRLPQQLQKTSVGASSKAAKVSVLAFDGDGLPSKTAKKQRQSSGVAQRQWLSRRGEKSSEEPENGEDSGSLSSQSAEMEGFKRERRRADSGGSSDFDNGDRSEEGDEVVFSDVPFSRVEQKKEREKGKGKCEVGEDERTTTMEEPLRSCSVCGRSFFAHRVRRHEAICAKRIAKEDEAERERGRQMQRRLLQRYGRPMTSPATTVKSRLPVFDSAKQRVFKDGNGVLAGAAPSMRTVLVHVERRRLALETFSGQRLRERLKREDASALRRPRSTLRRPLPRRGGEGGRGEARELRTISRRGEERRAEVRERRREFQRSIARGFSRSLWKRTRGGFASAATGAALSRSLEIGGLGVQRRKVQNK